MFFWIDPCGTDCLFSRPGLSVFVVQPILDSYTKLHQWLSKNSNNGANQSLLKVPENYVMIHFAHTPMSPEQFIVFLSRAKGLNPTVKFIQIPGSIAQSYLSQVSSRNGQILLARTEKLNEKPCLIVLDSDEEDNGGDDGLDKNGDEALKDDDDILQRPILYYPPNGPDAISLTGHDLRCLQSGLYLNDNIMNFYLRYLQCQLPQETRDRIHVYDALFALHLFKQTPQRRRLTRDYALYSVGLSKNEEASYHDQLKRWTKDIDIFAKDFLIVPLIKVSFFTFFVNLLTFFLLTGLALAAGHCSLFG